jgi:ribonuclease M5
MNPLNVSRETLPHLFVVEGKKDEQQLSAIIQSPILCSNGLGMTEEFVNELVLLENHYRIVLVLDPDGPGEKIRKTLSSKLQYPEHIFIPVALARSANQKKVGIEHVSRETLIKYLGDIKVNKPTIPLSTIQLYDLGLIGTKGSVERRERLCDTFGIGIANGKTLRSKLQLFGLSFERVKGALETMNE